MKHIITIVKGDKKNKINIRLNDDGKNGHEDFAITADVWEQDTRRGGWRESMGGCCHEHILSLRPDLKPFVDLHLCSYLGVPVHAVENAWYWFQGAFPESVDFSPNLGACHGGTGSSAKSPDECKAILASHLLATEAELESLRAAAPRSQQQLQYELEKAGFPAKWKALADSAIAELERLTGSKFESRATRATWHPLSPEAVADIEHKKASGYYLPEAVAARDAAAKQTAKEKRLAEIDKELSLAVKKAENAAKVERFFVNYDLKENHIYYDHTNMVKVNWQNYSAKYTQDEFDVLLKLAADKAAELPDGITFEFGA